MNRRTFFSLFGKPQWRAAERPDCNSFQVQGQFNIVCPLRGFSTTGDSVIRASFNDYRWGIEPTLEETNFGLICFGGEQIEKEL